MTRKTSLHEDANILENFKTNPTTTLKYAAADFASKKISESTSRTRLKRAKAKSVKSVFDELTTQHKEARTVWCWDAKVRIKEDPLFFAYTLFSDEAKVYLNEGGAIFGWFLEKAGMTRFYRCKMWRTGGLTS